MLSLASGAKSKVTILLCGLFIISQLAACSPNRTQVSEWWQNQRWQSESASL
jgi:hypothetical protein